MQPSRIAALLFALLFSFGALASADGTTSSDELSEIKAIAAEFGLTRYAESQRNRSASE